MLKIHAPDLDGEAFFARARSKAEIAEPCTREGCDAYITKEMGKIDPL